MSNALKKARRAFQKKKLSSSEESLDSISSGEFSHIPIPDSEISKLTESLSMANESAIEKMLAEIAHSLKILNDKTAEHDRALQNLSIQNAAGPSGHNNNAQLQQQQISPVSGDPFRIPDPIKTLPSYSGNKKQLHSWLETAEKTLNLFYNLVSPQIFQIYFTAVINKIEGTAKDILCTNGNPETFEHVKEILISALGDRQELSTYNCLLWHNQMNGSVPKHFQHTKQLVQNIKMLAKQNPLYNEHWEALNSFIDEYALAAYISGLEKPYFGYAQARGPKNIEEAYAFLCKFTSSETTKKVSASNDKFNNKPNFKQPEKKQFFNKQAIEIKKENNNSPAEPMEVDPSLRSRLTLNRRQINNNEIEHEEESDTEESDEENLAINFWQTEGKDQNT